MSSRASQRVCEFSEARELLPVVGDSWVSWDAGRRESTVGSCSCDPIAVSLKLSFLLRG